MLFETFTEETSFDVNVAKTLALMTSISFVRKLEIVVVGCNFLFSCTQAILEVKISANETNHLVEPNMTLIPKDPGYLYPILHVNGRDRLTGNRQNLNLTSTVLPATEVCLLV